VSIRVRRIESRDWSVLRALRLAALTDAPGAFGQTHDEAALQPDEEWRSVARAASAGDRRAWFLAVDDAARPMGLVLGRRRPPDECLLFSMWVHPAARRQGTGHALVQAVADWAAAWGASRVILWVILGNNGALRFYESIGFHVLTSGPDAESGQAYGAVAMERAIGG